MIGPDVIRVRAVLDDAGFERLRVGFAHLSWILHGRAWWAALGINLADVGRRAADGAR